MTIFGEHADQVEISNAPRGTERVCIAFPTCFLRPVPTELKKGVGNENRAVFQWTFLGGANHARSVPPGEWPILAVARFLLLSETRVRTLGWWRRR